MTATETIRQMLEQGGTPEPPLLLAAIAETGAAMSTLEDASCAVDERTTLGALVRRVTGG